MPRKARTNQADLRLYDCYALAGVSAIPPLDPALTPDDLLAEMDRCGVDEALVHSAAFEIGGALESNAGVAAFCVASPRLHPVWCILPEQTGEMEPRKLFKDMARQGVRTLRARPDTHRFLLNGLTCGRLLKELVRRRIPLFLDSNWPLVTAVLGEFPSLTAIVTNHGPWGSDRYFRPLLEHFPNLYLDTSTYELDGGIPALVAKYGAERLLFGSSYHLKPMGGATLLLRTLDLDLASKALIAHANLERLLAGVRL